MESLATLDCEAHYLFSFKKSFVKAVDPTFANFTPEEKYVKAFLYGGHYGIKRVPQKEVDD